jgi:ABC-type multidrug transport system ATPase subunit
VGLGDRTEHRLPELSGGEQQRVAIAVALANNPTLLLADEPTGEVDSTTARVIYKTFQDLTRDLGVTTLIVSHDPGIARHVGRVVAIRDGMLASETVRQTVLQNGMDSNGDPGAAGEEHVSFQELVVLDRAGRVHVPQEYLEQFNIKGRAQLELTEEGILIRPVMQHAVEQTADDEAGAAEQDEAADGNGRKGRWGFLSRLGRRRNRAAQPQPEAAAETVAEQQPGEGE